MRNRRNKKRNGAQFSWLAGVYKFLLSGTNISTVTERFKYFEWLKTKLSPVTKNGKNASKSCWNILTRDYRLQYDMTTLSKLNGKRFGLINTIKSARFITMTTARISMFLFVWCWNWAKKQKNFNSSLFRDFANKIMSFLD